MSERSRSLVEAGLIFATALAGAVAILSVPGLFGPDPSSQRWVTGLAGAVGLVLWAGAMYLRPPRREPAEPDGNGR